MKTPSRQCLNTFSTSSMDLKRKGHSSRIGVMYRFLHRPLPYSSVPLTCRFRIIRFVSNYRYIFLFAFEHTRSLVSPVRKILAFTDRRHLPSRLSPRSLVSATLRVHQHYHSLPPRLKRQVFLRGLDSADRGRCKPMSYYLFPCPATSS